MGNPIEDLDGFAFQNVFYEGEKSLSYFLQFSDENQFTVFAGDKKTEIGKGQIGLEIELENVRFTIEKAPNKLRINIFYPLSISCWQDIARSLRQQLKIVSQKTNKSI
jgi:hypothetical protein